MAIFRGSGGSLSGQTETISLPVAVSQGGTGQTTANNAFNALAPTQAGNGGKYLKTNGSTTTWDNIEINTDDLTGVLPIANGGTGASNATNARDNLGLEIGVDIPANNGTGATGTWAIDVTGNAATVTNGVYTTGSYSDPSWITSLAYSKLSGTVPTWNQNTTGNAATVTNGVYTTGSYSDPTWITSLAGSKVTGNISGNAANVTGTVAVANGGTGATTVANARVSLLPSYTGNAGKVLGLNGTATDVEWISGAGSGSVTSVALSAPTGFDVSGSPVTSTGTLALAFTSGYSLPTTTSQSNWDTAYTDRLKWDGGSTGLNASTARTSLGLVIGTDVQAYDAQLADVAGLTPTDTGVIIGNGTNFVVESGTTFRSSVGLAIGTNVPSPTGTGASGTWGISITGNAATATNGVVTTGSYADPTWITSLAGSKISGNISGNAANVTGTVAIANGGTGATTRQNAMDALAGAVTSGQYLRGNGTDVVMSAIQAADVPTLNQNTTGSAATLTTGRTIAITGDLTYTSPSFNGSANVTAAGTLATVNSNVGSFGSSTAIPVVTVNAKGLVTAVSTATVAGGQYFGSAATKAIAYNANTIGENVTVTAGNNGLSAGPITISNGFTVTVETGAAWVIV